MSEAAHLVTKAPLPVSYREAREALARCEQVDECKGWTDKAMALASYARQAKDQTLFDTAMRIHARAERRAGELLKEFDGKGRNQYSEDGGDAPTTQREAADAAGLSKDQQVQAVRVANVPAELFETLVEGDKPPTVTALAELGTKKNPKPAPQRPPDPHAGTWADWVFAVEHLSSLPACGLQALIDRDELPATRLLDEARAAAENLTLWINSLEDSHAKAHQ